MLNCLPFIGSPDDDETTNLSRVFTRGLAIETPFKLPAPIPVWPSGEGFGSGTMDLGGLQVNQISSFQKIWATFEGGPDNAGATLYEPSPVPEDFFMLGCYAQPSNTPLFGSVLVARDSTGSGSESDSGSLKKPVDYTLVWSSKSLRMKQDGFAYIWLPTPPDGYKAVGHLVTNSPDKPPLDKIRCVRSDLTDQAENDALIWSQVGGSSSADRLSVFSVRPVSRGVREMGVGVGTFTTAATAVACLRNAKSNLPYMPNQQQVEAVIQAYAPLIFFHPEEKYLPASVTWYFENGALLYKNGDESNPVRIDSTGSNLPQGGSNDGAYWMDLPKENKARELVKRGDLKTAQVYIQIKPMLGGTYTDIPIWFFYPFNGPARASIGFAIPLGSIGEHVGDWEHLTLRVSNFNGELQKIYFSQHSAGAWVNASELEFKSDSNRAVAYASLNGHAMYPKPGLVLQGGNFVGIRNDTAKSDKVLDTGGCFSIVSAEYLSVTEPPWLNYFRKWGPTVLRRIQVFGQDGPTSLKVKSSWNGDERIS